MKSGLLNRYWVIDSAEFDPSCTHIIAGGSIRTEKYLAGLATGKWILDQSYISACNTANRFVKEDDYEMHPKTDHQDISLAATRRWRLALKDKKGAFNCWKVILYCDGEDTHQLRRVLQAGGATVLAYESPYNDIKELTHIFVSQKKVTDIGVISELEKYHTPLLFSNYISEYLLNFPVPDPATFFVHPLVATDDKKPTKKKRSIKTKLVSKTTLDDE